MQTRSTVQEAFYNSKSIWVLAVLNDIIILLWKFHSNIREYMCTYKTSSHYDIQLRSDCMQVAHRGKRSTGHYLFMYCPRPGGKVIVVNTMVTRAGKMNLFPL